MRSTLAGLSPWSKMAWLRAYIVERESTVRAREATIRERQAEIAFLQDEVRQIEFTVPPAPEPPPLGGNTTCDRPGRHTAPYNRA